MMNASSFRTPLNPNEIVVRERDAGSRLDVFLAKMLSGKYSRSQIKKMIEAGQITVKGNEAVVHYHVKADDVIVMEGRDVSGDDILAEDIPIDIVAEDDEILVVNKAPGMVVHPACGNPHHTLVNAILFHVKNFPRFADPVRPGIVHRLDKDTSGIMVVAKNERAHAHLARQFKQHTIERVYHVLVKGVVQHNEGICEEPVGRAFLNRKKVIIKPSGGKDAITFFRVLDRFRKASLLEIRPKTGRTHQIRVHMNHLGHPVLGDSLYGMPSPWIDRQALHAKSLGFIHPASKKKVFYDSSLPTDILHLIEHLRQEE
ncbi:MAG: RluA family pseudouridine synthase [Candidatus Omnitrophica bacterium]|nr:RluA family pseudouridine synthase [Candidatus Omnitrophota bacterium]